MGKQQVRVKEVIYALSPFQQKIMSGLWKDLPSKIHHKVSENWIDAVLFLSPLVGTYTYVQHYKERERSWLIGIDKIGRIERKAQSFIILN